MGVPSFVDYRIVEDAKTHAASMYPNESCGLVYGGNYVPCDNVHAEPTKFFKIRQDILDAQIIAGNLQGIIHSHPKELLKEKSCPSKEDMESQMSVGVPYGIIDLAPDVVNAPYWWGDFQLDEPMIGVPFHHGINDCYTVVRRWFWQNRKIKLPDVPRDASWWVSGDDLYVRGFESIGFTKITREELTNGDCMLGKIMSKQINHAGVYLNNNEDGLGVVLHHLPNRLSRREPAGPYIGRADLCLRYTNVP